MQYTAEIRNILTRGVHLRLQCQFNNGIRKNDDNNSLYEVGLQNKITWADTGLVWDLPLCLLCPNTTDRVSDEPDEILGLA
jgi:hypothetical protein